MKYYVVLYLHPTKEDRKVSLTIPPSRKWSCHTRIANRHENSRKIN
jgi:hypothetical protein